VVLGLYKARPLTPDELPELQHIVRELAKRTPRRTATLIERRH
jgi:hypothetical protein